MPLIIELLKFLGSLVTTVAAIAGVYLDNMKNLESGRITRRGRFVIAFALAGLTISGVSQIVQQINAAQTADAINQRNLRTALRLERALYPLEPLSIEFTLVYPMDQKTLLAYAARVRRETEAAQTKIHPFPRYDFDRISQKDVSFLVFDTEDKSGPEIEFLKRTVPLLSDQVSFQFDAPQGSGQTLQFNCMPKEQLGVYVKRRSFGDLVERVELRANFARGNFEKTVRCINPMRSGDDLLAVSALDLVGRNLKCWVGKDDNIHLRLTDVALVFSYDSGFEEQNARIRDGRKVSMKDCETPVLLQPENVGLKELYEDLRSFR